MPTPAIRKTKYFAGSANGRPTYTYGTSDVPYGSQEITQEQFKQGIAEQMVKYPETKETYGETYSKLVNQQKEFAPNYQVDLANPLGEKDYSAYPNYVNVGTAQAPQYVPKGSAGLANLQNPVKDKTLASLAPTTSQNATQTPQGGAIAPQTGQTTYPIQSGDTLSAIAQKNGTTVAALMALNPQITDPNKIYAGQSLNLSSGQTQGGQQQNQPTGAVQEQIQNAQQQLQQLQQQQASANNAGYVAGTATGNQQIPEDVLQQTPQTPIIPEVSSTAITTSDGLKNADAQKKIDEAKAILEKSQQQDQTINDLTQQKTIADLQASLGITKPATPSFQSNYEALRSTQGVSALETRMNELKQQKLALQDSLQSELSKIENNLEPIELIDAEQREKQRIIQDKFNEIDRNLAQVQDEYNTKVNLISNIMSLQQTDYKNAVENYNTQFNQAIKFQELLSGQQDKAIAQQNVQSDNARANIQVVLNTLKDTGTDWNTMDSTMQTQLLKLGLQAGIDSSVIQTMFDNLGDTEKVISTDLLTDKNGNQFLQVLKQNNQGEIIPEKIPTTGVKKTEPTAGQVSDIEQNNEIERVKSIFSKAPVLGTDLYVDPYVFIQERQNSAPTISPTEFDNLFGSLINPLSWNLVFGQNKPKNTIATDETDLENAIKELNTPWWKKIF